MLSSVVCFLASITGVMLAITCQPIVIDRPSDFGTSVVTALIGYWHSRTTEEHTDELDHLNQTAYRNMSTMSCPQFL